MLIQPLEIIKKTANLYKENFNVFLQYILLLLIPNGTIAVLQPFVAKIALSDTATNSMLFNGYMVLVVISWFLTFWISAGLIRVLYAKYTGKEVKDIKTELLNVKHLLLPAILASILTAIIVALGMVLFIIPGVIFSVWYIFSTQEVIINEKKVMDALKSSKELVTGRWFAVLWRLFATIIVFSIAMAIVTGTTGVILSGLISVIGKNSSIYTVAMIIINLVVSFVSLLFVPLTTGVIVLLFSELQKTPKVAEVAQKQ